MSKQVILHVGMQKTGTSALQDFLFEHREYLLSNFKIYYPITGVIGTGHHNLSALVSEDFLHELKKNLNVYDKVIISCEDLNIRKGYIHNIIMNLRKIQEFSIKIVLYIRRQDKFLESYYKQMFKNDYVICISSLEDLAIKYRNILNYYENTKIFLEKNKSVEFVLLLYAPKFLQDNNIIVDFFDKILDIDIKAHNLNVNKTSNPSLSVESVLALRKFNEKYKLPPEKYRILIKYVNSLEKDRKSRKKYIISLEERLKILEFYRESNEKLFREFFNSDNLFVLSEEEIKEYEANDEYTKEHENEIELEIETRYELIKNYVEKELGGLNSYLRKYISTNSSGFRRIFGWIEKLNENFVSGWVVNTNISEPSEIEVLIDGYSLVSTKCQKFREDIKHIYGIDYNTHFHINWKDISYTKEFLEYLLSKPLDAELNVLVREKASGYVIEGNYEPIYVKDLLEKISQNGIVLTKKIKGINSIFVKGFILQTKKKLRACVSEQAKVTLIKNGQGLAEIFIYTENKDNKVIPLELIYEDGSSEYVELSISV